MKLSEYISYKDFNLYYIFILFIFFSFLFSKLFVGRIFGINLALFDIAILIIAFYLLLKKKFEFNEVKYSGLFLLYFLSILFLDLAFNYSYYSDIVIKKKILLFLQLLRSIICFHIILISIKNCNLDKILRLLIDLFVIYSLLIIILYFNDLIFFSEIVSKFYEISIFPRLFGFYRDPNMLSFFSLFFFLISINLKKPKIFSSILFLLITLFTFSKSSILFLIIYATVYCLFLIRKKRSKFSIKDKIFIYTFIFLSIILFLIVCDFWYRNLADKGMGRPYFLRFTEIFNILNHKRFINLEFLIQQNSNFFIGNGPFEATKILTEEFASNDMKKVGSQIFSHNSFIDIYYDFGFFGLALFIFWYLKSIGVIKNIKKLRNFWLFYTLLLFLYLLFFTFFYLPFFWFTLAMSKILVDNEYLS